MWKDQEIKIHRLKFLLQHRFGGQNDFVQLKTIIMTKYIIPVLFLFMLATGCKKYDLTDTADQVGTSKVTYFAELTLTGEPYMSLVQGSTFTDPGATATEKGQSIKVTSSGTVNTNQPGMYIITYSAINKDGFAATTQRTVVVLTGHETSGVDVSGNYAYVGSGTYSATITKVAEGVYTTDNIYGSATIPAVFVTLDGATVTIPTQNTAYGPLFGTGTYAAGLLTVTFNLPKQNISNRVRKWQKQ
jgi:hypothetical protein